MATAINPGIIAAARQLSREKNKLIAP
jgi:hypothetical protein